jgi:hypothetical protein
MKSIKLLILTTIFLINSFPAFALENDLGLWTPVYIKLPVTKKLQTQLEINPRIQENVSDFNQLLIRPSVGYQVTKHLSLWQGYAWITNYIPKFVSEQRLWEQILYEREFGRWGLSSRTRLEERFIQNVHGVPVRFREMLRAQYTLDKKKNWAFVVYDESFINLSTHFRGPQAGVDQNRFFVGLNRKVTKYANVEGGYLMQYFNIQSPTQDIINHNVLVNLYINLPQLAHLKSLD